ncbi:MAG: mechanosensitive ion channel family protein, partial [Chitinophagales bacterium]
MQEFLQRDFLDNTMRQYMWVAGVLLFILLFNGFISRVISKLLFRLVKRSNFKDKGELFLKQLLKPVQYLIVLQAIFIGLTTLHQPAFFEEAFLGTTYEKFFYGIYRLLAILSVAWLFSRIADFFTEILRLRAEETPHTSDDQIAAFLKDVLRVIVWSGAILTIFAVVLHINVTSLLAGAGIAGIAIAFAAQETLQNLFGSISIFTERPFVVGDLVEVDGIQGTVEKVGFRSTRVRTMDKVYVTVPNKNIVNNKMNNLTLRTSRRVQFIIGLTYQTPEPVLKEIIFALREHAEVYPKRNDRYIVTLYNFSAYSIDIWYDIMLNYDGWEEHMVTRSALLFDILRIVKENGGEFA